MGLTIQSSGERLTARLAGEIDHHTAKELREQIDRSLTLCRPALLVLDFSDVGFMDSSGVGLVMGRYRLVSGMGGTLHITGASPAVKKMFLMGGIARLATLDD